MTNYREILRLQNLGFTNSRIANALGVSRTTIVRVLQQAKTLEINYSTASTLSDRELIKQLFPQEESKPAFKMPDYDWVHRELTKPGVTLQLLWFEYCDKCRSAGEIPYQLTQFKKYYRDYAVQTKATMHITHKPGEQMEVDWAGQTTPIINDETGEIIKAYVFVAVLPYSGYAYAEAFFDQTQQSWIAAHIGAFEYFGGVTKIIVPDNLKTGITKHTKSEIILNHSYQEMAEHYGTAIIPTRIRSPKDKATVEATVGIISTFILAAIRNQKFFTLAELNAEIRKLLYKFNHKPFQRKEGSRVDLFADERGFLLLLPVNAYELSEWKKATVQYNYHIQTDGHYYSVPFEYIKQVVDVRLTRQVVEVFCDGNRVCSHVRLYGKRELYSTQITHMPPNHREYMQWNSSRFKSWAATIGTSTTAVIDALFAGYRVEQQGYRTCMSLLKLSEQFTPKRLETACGIALSYTPRPSYKAIQTILKSGRDKSVTEPLSSPKASKYGFTRGSDYYSGGCDNA